MDDAQPHHETEQETELFKADHPQGPPEWQAAWPDPAAFLEAYYGLSGEIGVLQKNPPSFLLKQAELTCRLDFTRDPVEAERFHAEAAILLHLRLASGQVDVPEPLAAADGTWVVEPDGTDVELPLSARLLTLPQAEPSTKSLRPSSDASARIGTYLAHLIRDLEAAQPGESDDDMPLLRATSDLRQAGPAIVKLLRDVSDADIRDPIAKVMVSALRRVQPLGPHLRTQLIHHHPIGIDLLGQIVDGNWQPSGFVDPSPLGQGWVVALLAASCAELVGMGTDGALDILPAVMAFHAHYPLLAEEVKALWPLTVVRIGLLRSTAERQAAHGTATAAVDSVLEEARRRFDVASSVHPAVMEAALFDALGWPLPETPELELLLPEIDATQIRLVDLSVESPLFVAGNFEDPDIDWRLLARAAWETQMGATRFGEFRLSRSLQQDRAENQNFALHVDFCLPAGAQVHAPIGGMLKQLDGRLVLSGKEATLQLEGLDCILADETALFAGDRMGIVAGREGSVGGLRIRLCREPDLTPPLFATERMAGAWKRLALSPSLILGTNLDAPASRAASPVRGWRDRLYDSHGRCFVDLSGAAGLLGYGHPVMAEAAYSQWLLLNGLAGTKAQADFRTALLAHMPKRFDRVLALSDGMQAMEFAHELARAHSGDDKPLRIADERRTGFGRLGDVFWQFERDEDMPDIIVTGSPVPGEALAAVIVSSDRLPPALLETLPAPTAGAVACRIGTAVLETLDDEPLREQAREVGEALHHHLQSLLKDRPALAAIEGEGLAIDLVLEGMEPMELARTVAGHGVLLHATGGDRVALTAPLCLSITAVDRLVRALDLALPLAHPSVAQPEAPQQEASETSLPDSSDHPI
ncbi:aminotransferase class III-fold pyridoxal phosphate-dependent enzyme [Rhizobium sp. FY34]|uniref:aminotransferase class III-fold pyridoxal phosphate-dependent enzyme n=1 Tax=Rhizobium sp. FY34 TaxID=2562309 RepID=UPI0014850710|nr:aminotransferase class III-fold pyridoxal phosphate-dependent enzyme [Rhizobium sp. FY34]